MRPILVITYLVSVCCGFSTSSNTCRSPTDLQLDVERLKQTIREGRVYQQLDFLPSQEVQELLTEIKGLEDTGKFQRSGLSNTVKGSDQKFGIQDRAVCAVPWWNDLLRNNNGSSLSSNTATASTRIHYLRTTLAQQLERPTMLDTALAHECYYSIGGPGSFLPRHMDERHEEMKGAKGWLLPSRRSLSWLIYLSDENWTLAENGGALRTFPQAKLHGDCVGSQHDGNLQIGWLRDPDGSRPVYMDSWYKSPHGQEVGPHCVLYTIRSNDRIILTRPWLNDALQGMSAADFLLQYASRDSKTDDDESKTSLFLRREYAQAFSLLEDRAAWDDGRTPQGSIVEDISPIRGSLVVFDSVLLPHQVEEIIQGRRIAVAGWMHEATQPFPEELYM